MKYCLQQKKKQENIFVKMIEECVDVINKIILVQEFFIMKITDKAELV